MLAEYYPLTLDLCRTADIIAGYEIDINVINIRVDVRVFGIFFMEFICICPCDRTGERKAL